MRTYNNDIENLKEKLVTYQTNSSHLKSDLRVIKNRYIEIESKTRCEACSVPIFNMEFYIFPCMHAVHKECLIRKIENSPFDQEKLSTINKLNAQVQELVQKSIDSK